MLGRVYYELTDSFDVAADIDRCWRFFGTAENLPLITPPWLRFTIAMPMPLPVIGQDAVLDYSIRWLGAAVKWRTKIIDWSPPRQFVDLQIRGPYALWHHQHRFEAIDGGAETTYPEYQKTIQRLRAERAAKKDADAKAKK